MNAVNIFFIMNGFLQYNERIKTNSPWSTHAPVLWVIIMGIIFEFLEERKRSSQDSEDNNIKVTKINIANGSQTDGDTISLNLHVGDLIKLKDNQLVPADCVVLQTSDSKGLCFISTESLDGERNLKTKLASTLT